MSNANRQILLDQLSQGPLSAGNFRLVETPSPRSVDGEVLLSTRFISLDAANRAWMLGPTYRSALRAGQLMPGTALGEVVESKSAASW